MAEEDQRFPSKLKSRAAGPVRGLGAGYAQNQRLAGAGNPEAAAKLASMGPSEVTEQLENAEQVNADATERRNVVLDSVVSGFFSPPNVSAKNAEEWKAIIARQTDATIQRWYIEIQELEEKVLEEETEAQVRETVSSSLRIQPDEHIYDPLTDKERRKLIESKLRPLDFEEMVFTGSTTQDVPVHGNLTITFRSLSTQHGLWLEWHVARTLQDVSTQYLRHTFSLLQLGCCIDKVNGKPFGSDLTKYVRENQRDEFLAALEGRMERVKNFPAVLTDDLIVQYIWFCGRLRKLMSGNLLEKVGNS